MDSLKQMEINNIKIREVLFAEEFEQLIDIQREAWQCTDEEIVQVNALEIINSQGLILVAIQDGLSKTQNVVGFTLSIPKNCSKILSQIHSSGITIPDHIMKAMNYYDIQLKEAPNACFNGNDYYMHLIATRNNLTKKSIGEYLQTEQRTFLLKRGISTLEWTFDPLISVNANMFIHKCGAKIISAKHFKRNFYGEDLNGTYSGIPTDRFVAVWHLNDCNSSNQPKPTFYDYVTLGGKSVIKTEEQLLKEGDLIVPFRIVCSYDLNLKTDILFVEIPTNYIDPHVDLIDRLKNNTNRIKWRYSIREIMEHYLSEGYIVDDLFFNKSEGSLNRAYYLLKKLKREGV